MKRPKAKEATVLSGRRVARRTKASSRQKQSQPVESEEEAEFDKDSVMEVPTVLRVLLSSQQALFFGLLAFRIVNALLIQTSYVPDEYWQSIEVAHKMVFGYGYLTWEWVEGIRSYVYPLLFATVYKLLALLHLDTRIILIKSPRLIQAVLAAVGDLYLYKLSARLGGRSVGRWALFCQLTSWFTFYTCTRTLSNSTESVLTTAALYYFPWPHRTRKSQWKLMVLVLLAIVIRPTAAIMWLPMGIWYLVIYRQAWWLHCKLAAELGFLVIYLAGMVDRVCYAQWVWVQYNFLKFNVFHNIASFYGSHPAHWYLSQGLPVVLGSHVFAFVVGVRKAVQPAILALIAWTVFVLSCLEHKEFRFLLPALPLVMLVCGWVLSGYCRTPDNAAAGDEDEDEEGDADGDASADGGLPPSPLSPSSEGSNDADAVALSSDGRRWWKWACIVGLIATNLPVALYTCLIHQRGVIDVTWYLHEQSVNAPANVTMNITFLMPCHSTPYYSYIHRNVTMRFLTCEPNLTGQSNYTDEADIFYADPQTWLDDWTRDLSQDTYATHLVMFNSLSEHLLLWLHGRGYLECARHFHTHFPDGRVGSHVLVYCHTHWLRQEWLQRQKDTVLTVPHKQLRSELL